MPSFSLVGVSCQNYEWVFRADKLIVLMRGEQLSDDLGTQVGCFLAWPAWDAPGTLRGIGAGAPGNTGQESPHALHGSTPGEGVSEPAPIFLGP